MRDERDIAMSPDERSLRTTLAGALNTKWVADKEREGTRKLIFVDGEYRIHDFHNRMCGGGNDLGYALGAKVFRAMLVEKAVDAKTRSHVLTRLACTMYEIIGMGILPITETQASWFGRFAQHLLYDDPRMFVAWAEDMNVDDPYNAMTPQPTALIRGALFAPALDQAKMSRASAVADAAPEYVPFWELAVRSPSFPMRVFSDPCQSNEGCIFSSYHRRVLTAIFSNVSEATVRIIGAFIRENATQRCVVEIVKGVQVETPTKACDRDRKSAFEMIVQSVMDLDRRALVAESLGIEVPKY